MKDASFYHGYAVGMRQSLHLSALLWLLLAALVFCCTFLAMVAMKQKEDIGILKSTLASSMNLTEATIYHMQKQQAVIKYIANQGHDEQQPGIEAAQEAPQAQSD
jgi:hypothetical protein